MREKRAVPRHSGPGGCGGEGGQDQVTQAVFSQARVRAPQASAMLS